MRAFLGGRGQVQWPDLGRINDVRTYLIRVTSSLEAFRQSWAAQLIQDRQKAKEGEQEQARKVALILRKKTCSMRLSAEMRPRLRNLSTKGLVR